MINEKVSFLLTLFKCSTSFSRVVPLFSSMFMRSIINLEKIGDGFTMKNKQN